MTLKESSCQPGAPLSGRRACGDVCGTPAATSVFAPYLHGAPPATAARARRVPVQRTNQRRAQHHAPWQPGGVPGHLPRPGAACSSAGRGHGSRRHPTYAPARQRRAALMPSLRALARPPRHAAALPPPWLCCHTPCHHESVARPLPQFSISLPPCCCCALPSTRHSRHHPPSITHARASVALPRSPCATCRARPIIKPVIKPSVQNIAPHEL